MLKSDHILYQRLQSYLSVIDFNVKIMQDMELIIKKLSLYPIHESLLIALPAEKRAYIDAIVYRFLMSQDYIGNKVFSSLAQIITEEASRLTRLDIVAMMEKHLVISSEEDWDQLRKLRNLLSHEYEAIPNLRAADLNRLFETLPLFYKQVDLIRTYVKTINQH